MQTISKTIKLEKHYFVTKRITRSENIVWNKNTNRSKTGKTDISSLLSKRHFQSVYNLQRKWKNVQVIKIVVYKTIRYNEIKQLNI